MIDTHCHLTYDSLGPDPGAVIQRAKAAGVGRMVTIGTSPPDARKAVALAESHEGVYAAAGLHPHYAADWQDKAALCAELRELLARPRVVAIGEMGLDRHYTDPPLEMQRASFLWQLELAHETGLPVIIHSRESVLDVVPLLRGSGIAPERFVFHCFTGNDTELDAILDFGGYVSYTGVVTFKNSQHIALASNRVPDERIMIETDTPYLTPAPHRKVRVNEPMYLPHIARHLAQVRGVPLEDFITLTDQNAERFFRLPGTE